MRTRLNKALFVMGVGTLTVVVASVSTPQTAAAQSLFDTLFGGLRRAIERPHVTSTSYTDPNNSYARATDAPPPRRSEASGPARGFCVRTCDGHYFPVQSSGNVSSAEMCHAFCPASETKVYSGSNIDYATTRDGSRYGDLANAYLYRKQVVNGCTCNGRDAFGLAHIKAAEDPTLKQGDVVATNAGLVVYSGSRNKTADFTPVQSYSGFSKSYRQMLSELKLMQPNPGAPPEVVSSIGNGDDRRSASLSR